MARPRIELGSHSPIETAPYRIEGGKRTRCTKRQAKIWRARCTFRAQDGTAHDITRWAQSEPEAFEAVEAAIRDRANADDVLSLRPGMPFREAAQVWAEQIARPDSGLSARTIEDYTGALNRYVVASGSVLRGVTLEQANDVQRLLVFLRAVADSKGSETARLCRTVLSSVFKMCVSRNVLTTNAARQTGAVKATKPETDRGRDHRRAFTREERQRVIATADAMIGKAVERDEDGAIVRHEDGSPVLWPARNPRSGRIDQTVADVVAFLAATGARIQEARLLQWADVDLEAGTVHLRGTKTASSDRVVNLPSWCAERLARRKPDLPADAMPYVFGSPNSVFEDEDGKWIVAGPAEPLDQSNLSKRIREVLDAAGCEWAVPHSFRRTVATFLHEAKVPLVRIADQLGHADPTMTARVYLGRDLRGDKSDLAELL